MKSTAPLAAALLALVSAVACGSSDAPGASAPDGVEEITEPDATLEETFDDLGPDAEPMLADDEVDRLAERPDAVQDEEASAELDREEREAGELETAALSAKPQPKPVRCKRRIHVVFAVYTYLTEQLRSNGCWTAEDTVGDASFRDCHSDGSVKHPKGDKWFYDDTNPRNALGAEESALYNCSRGAGKGYEYMAFRDGRWRLVRRPNAAAYFAELYTDDAHIDDLWYVPSVYRANHALRRHRRVAPMLNFAPWPDGRYSQRQIAHEVLKVCKTVRNHGYFGLYEWHYPLPHDSARVANLARALNACTRR
jgi:hypothetical protein